MHGDMGVNTQISDAAFVEIALSGDSKAFDALVKRFQRAVHAVAFAVVADREAALDVLQESFIAAYRQLHTLDDPSKFGHWICGIARNQAKRLRRTRNRRNLRELPLPEMEAVWERSQTETLAESIRDALTSLTEIQADVVTLFYMEGYSIAECSLLLDVPQGTIKRRLHDARQRLKKEMTDMVKENLKEFKLPDEYEAWEYDLYGHPHTEERDCEFLKQVFESYHEGVRDVLDLACGTGRHALVLAKDGYGVTGVDITEGMLAAAAEKAAARGVSVTWVQADVREMEFSAQFDAAYILFNMMMCWTTNDEQIRFLGRVHEALRPGGVFIIEVPNYWALLANGELKNSTSRWESKVESNGVKRVRDTTLTVSSINNLAYVNHHERSWRGDQELEPRDLGNPMRLFSLNELDILCRLTHFEIRDVFGTMDMTQKLGDTRLVARMENPPGSYVLVLRKLA